mgnify:CR=1 FL=1
MLLNMRNGKNEYLISELLLMLPLLLLSFSNIVFVGSKNVVRTRRKFSLFFCLTHKNEMRKLINIYLHCRGMKKGKGNEAAADDELSMSFNCLH